MPLNSIEDVVHFKEIFETDLVEINSKVPEIITKEQGDQIIQLLQKFIDDKQKNSSIVTQATQRIILHSICAFIQTLVKYFKG